MPGISEGSNAVPQDYPVKSLLHIAVRKLALFPDMHLDNLNVLPEHLKTHVLTASTKGGKINNETLKSLLHSDVLELDLRECPVCDETLENIAICRRLEKLILCSGRGDLVGISPSALRSLFPNFPSLVALSMSKCDGVTDEVINILGKSCPFLMELDISGCSMITDLAMKHLKNLEHLTSLNISSTKVTDRGILALVRGSCSESLSELKLADCGGITDFAIETIVLHCANMKVLIFHGCPVTAHLVPDVTDAATYTCPSKEHAI